jgi:small subunit ribosomal protein S16
MVRIRLRRTGAKNQPAYRIVAAEKEKPRDGRFLEILGYYNPRTEPATIQVDEARLFHWLNHGAQPSESVKKILQVVGAWDRWNRYRDGEDIEKLLEEAEADKLEVDPRTRRDDLVSKKTSKKAKKKAAEAAATETEAAATEEPEPVAEVESKQAKVEESADQEVEAEEGEDEAEVAEEESEPSAEQGEGAQEEEQEEPEAEASEEDEEEK